MSAEACWELFRLTGAPAFYLLYAEQSAAENTAESA